MTEPRHLYETPRRFPVMVSGTLWLLVALWSALLVGPARAEEPVDLQRALLEARRQGLSLDRRLAAVSRILASEDRVDAEAAARAALSLLEPAPEPACWLLLRATDEGWLPERLRAQLIRVLDARLEAIGPDKGKEGARLTGAGLLLGRRPLDTPLRLTANWPPDAFVGAVLQREIGDLRNKDGTRAIAGDAAAVRRSLETTTPIATALDRATADDPKRMHGGLAALLRLDARSVPLLLHEAAAGARAAPAGRMPRAVRAILALGLLKDRRATPVLSRCLGSNNGWVRVAAATALGDLGDPAGAVPLAVHLATLGDLFRTRDQWDYPGQSETNLSEAEWQTAPYFVVDCAAADSLLRLGISGATGYLIEEKLDPSKANYRIRVFQDAVDAIRRSVREAPIAAYNVDAGLPQRDQAFTALANWWHRSRKRTDLLDAVLDEDDAGFRKAARQLAERLRGKDVRQFMITKPACALLGRCMTPTLIETLGTATRGAARSELAKALGLVNDPRAVPPLLGLLQDPLPYVRAAAAEALGAYAARADVQTALIQMLGDRKEGPRVSAVKGLVGAPRSAQVLDAVLARTPRQPTAGYAMAKTVLLLVQQGDRHWPAIEAGLRAEHRYQRVAWWKLLRRGLDLPAYLNDASATPDAPRVRRLGHAQVLEALEGRSGPPGDLPEKKRPPERKGP